MPFLRPTLTALRTQAMQDITASDLPGADGLLRRAVLRVLAWVQAGMAYLHYGYLDWIAKEGLPFTCDSEFLEGWAGLKSVQRLPATQATGSAQFSGTNGVVLPSGTGVSRSDGAAFVTTAAGTVAGLAVTVPIQAVIPGSAGDSSTGTQFSLSTPIEGINAIGAASTAITGGADQETDSSLRTRMLKAYQNPPQGGAKSDYVEWALSVPGVTRAWCNPMGAGAGTVVVYTMLDVSEAAYDGFPQGANGVSASETRGTAATGDQLAVANYIYPLQPVTALIYSYAPIAQPLGFTVSGLNPGTTAMQIAVTAALSSLLVQKGSPLADTLIDQSDVDAAISAVPGVISFRVTAPTFPQTPALGSIFTLGTVTYL